MLKQAMSWPWPKEQPQINGEEREIRIFMLISGSFPLQTVVAAAALENLNFDPKRKIMLDGGCGEVSPKGYWLRNDLKGRRFKLNLWRAYGSSCNGFFQTAVNEVGFGPIVNMAKKFGWNNSKIVGSDFAIPPAYQSPRSSHLLGSYGRTFCSGFWLCRAVCGPCFWQMLAIANGGYARPLNLFIGDETGSQPSPFPSIMEPETANKLISLMDATVLGGTATSSFRKGIYRKLRRKIGGKTGTLTDPTLPV